MVDFKIDNFKILAREECYEWPQNINLYKCYTYDWPVLFWLMSSTNVYVMYMHMVSRTI
jgi:hypothetical protein